MLLLLCPDTPTGKWSERAKAAEQNRRELNVSSHVVDIPADTSASSPSNLSDDEEKKEGSGGDFKEKEAEVGDQEDVDYAMGQVIHNPTWAEAMKVVFSPSTMVLGLVNFIAS